MCINITNKSSLTEKKMSLLLRRRWKKMTELTKLKSIKQKKNDDDNRQPQLC